MAACAATSGTAHVASSSRAASADIPMPGGEVGIAYDANLSATGGKAPYTWSLDSGSLPAGLTLDSDGSVAGVPTAAGAFSFTVKASDARTWYTMRGATITIAAHLAATLVPDCQLVCFVEQGCVNACGQFGTQSGGVAPFRYSAAGNIPGGMKLSGLSLAGAFPSLARYRQFNVTITDALGAIVILSPIFYVYPHIALAPGTCSGNVSTGCSGKLRISGGNPNGTPSVKLVGVSQNPNHGCWIPTATTPPPGYALTVGAGYVTVTIPSGLTNGYAAVWTLVLTDQSVCGSGTYTYCTSQAAKVTIGVTCG